MNNRTMAKNIFLDFTQKDLNKQYRQFSSRLKQPIEFEQFVNLICPECSDSTYTLYRSSFDNRTERGKGDVFIMHDLVLLPHKILTSNYYLPDDQMIMLQGRIECVHGAFYKFSVEAIRLIDRHSVPQREVCCEVTGVAKNAFKNASFSKGGFSGRDFGDTAIDFDIMEFLTRHSIMNIESSIDTIDKWKEYLAFREYYVNNASSLSFRIDKCEVIKARMIRKEDYGRDLDSAPFLDGHSAFGKVKKDDFIYLSEAVPGDEECTVIKLSIIENKKDIDPNADRKLRRLLRNQLMLDKIQTEDNQEGDTATRHNTKRLGCGNEIFIKRIETEIEPDYSTLEKERHQKLNDEKTHIEANCRRELEEIIESYRQTKERELRSQLQSEYYEFAERLDRNLDSDIERNDDPIIIAKSKREATRIARSKKMTVEDALSLVDVAAIYRQRNEDKKKDLKEKQKKRLNQDLDDATKKRREDESLRLENKKKAELDALQKEIDSDIDTRKQQLAADQTKRLTEVYLLCDDNSAQHVWEAKPYDEIKYDPMMDKAKMNRQKDTLEKLRSGCCLPNPMMVKYLFCPSNLPEVDLSLSDNDIEWENKRLNDSQKEAVRKALCASGLFLIQGPPGTGKTTVIAEITAQLIKRNMRVVIASETHKAIDNAFEEIEELHMPQTHLLRILPQERDNNKWKASALTENFYSSIIDNLERQLAEYNYFENARADFNDKLSILHNYNRSIKNQKETVVRIQQRLTELSQQSNLLDSRISSLHQSKKELEDRQNGIRKQINSIQQLRLDFTDDEYLEELIRFNRAVGDLQEMAKYEIFKTVTLDILMDIDTNELDHEIYNLEQPDEFTKLEIEMRKLRGELEYCRDEIGEVREDKKEEYKTLQKKLLAIKNQKEKIKNTTSNARGIGENLQRLNVICILDNKDKLRALPQLLRSFQREIKGFESDSISRLDGDLRRISEEIRKNEEETFSVRNEIASCRRQIEELKSDNALSSFRDAESKMDKALVDFFCKFNITTEYPKGNYDAALAIVIAEWEKRCSEFDSNRHIFEARKRVLQNISRYKQDGAVERDNQERDMQQKLKDHANVIGLTSTANYNSDVDLDETDIDVVIIDEVSKSSFLDLLRPMLYGKKVILVGDHMQLPPMYDLKHLRDNGNGQNDFEGLDENIITPSINEEYKKLVETCYFKELYQKVPPANKAMLDRQYRMHSKIMKLNPFYNGRLKIGDPNLDARKQHGLEITVKGKKLISSDDHIVFVDCGDSHESKTENSSSLINEGEADVVMELLHQIAMQTGEKNKLTVGVICTYGMQANIIKRKMNKDKSLSGLRKLDKERLIVSTVDDFQGDERDIIILSMVRNPTGWNNRKAHYNLDFIQEYQRINVAITRPRRLLIIVGAKEFLVKKARVDLPGENGQTKYDEPVFEEIIHAVDRNVFMDEIVDVKEYKNKKEYYKTGKRR